MNENVLNKSMWKKLALVALAGAFYVGGQYIASQPQRLEQEAEINREITVSGRGEVVAVPDVARITLSVQTGTQQTAEKAMEILTDKFSRVVKSVSSAGVKDEDIKAKNVNLRPVYDFESGRRQEKGFEASESIEVTIRDLSKISDILGRSTIEGVNQIGNLIFEIDESDELQIEAQEEAIKNAREKASKLAKAMGMQLGKVKRFGTGSEDGPTPMFARAELSLEENAGGPPVPAGSQDIVANVNITFELK